MKRKPMAYLLAIAVIGIVAGVVWKFTARTAYESAEYQVIQSEAPFEVRRYPELTLVSTKMRSAASGNDGSFMRLFRYISGANQSDQKVAMTTPVFMEPEHGTAAGRMGFVMPKGVASRGAPKPVEDDVEIRSRQGGRFAVIRFSGRLDDQSAAQAENRLRQWLQVNDLAGVDESEIAGYDPPWTPGPLRRNEILVRLVQ